MRFHIQSSWHDQEEDETETHEFDFNLREDNTFTLLEQTNFAVREMDGTWQTLDYKDGITKIRLTDLESWKGFQDITLTGTLTNPEFVTGAVFMHQKVPFVSR
ncbi:Herc [Acrasis kona]|uniref:Herc n=1 Tax=Acrasis kona TaxID=1008807 RepID=A0AAW2YHF2_9EUKA